MKNRSDVGRGKRTIEGRATLGDALSVAAKKKLDELRSRLVDKAASAIQAMKQQPQPIWRSPSAKTEAVRRHVSINASNRVLAPSLVDKKPPPPRSGSGRGRGASVSQARPTYWTLPVGAVVRELPPQSVSPTNRTAVEETLRQATKPLSNSGQPLFAILGVDFGTSCTKVIARFPEEPGSPTVIVPSPIHCQSNGNPFLWQTVLWRRIDGTFIVWPEEGAVELRSLKQNLVAPSGLGSMDEGIVAAAAYVTFVIRHAIGWLLGSNAAQFRNRTPIWFVNVGLPAENYDNKLLLSAYRRAAACGLQLAKADLEVTLESVRVFMNHEAVLAAANSKERAENLGVAVLPEVAAEVAGFARSVDRADGLYLMVDVGAMTLDVCAFNIVTRAGGGERYAMFAAQVRHLGVEAQHWYLSERRSGAEFQWQCDQCVREVVWDTKRVKEPTAARWRAGQQLPVFLAGGGAPNEVHSRVVRDLGPWLRTYTGNDGIDWRQLNAPRDFNLPRKAGDFGRFAVAWGLTYPPSEIGEIMPMSEIEDMPSRRPSDIGGRFTSKDQV